MVENRIALEGLSLVVRGVFAPSIVSPAWFKAAELVGDIEVGDAAVELIARDIASFSMDWLEVHVTPDTFQVTTASVEEFPRLRDVMLGVLRVLDQAPVGALGINRYFHASVESASALHRIGDRIVPKDDWADLLHLPGTRSATLWGVRTDGYGGRVQLQIEPSFKVEQAVFVAVNDHFDLTLVPSHPASREEALAGNGPRDPDVEPTLDKRHIAMRVLTGEWAASLGRAGDVLTTVLQFQEKQ
ncbi:hypothetical protein ARHIZOSPH14_06690 [Agromyces rhizosphaerae]|uniref:Uncharacterized protein n=1 Tax=Agromyces rhizosphaerae TaxID=88374 RepID=A0A9W6CU49_9MICO|nr:hypothetical protein [Agromyces rhizosphaerae]GLI26427.1 hypothetical protein ARHIZOSPH14_06690 [Agromyces rhizosphaerae]